MFKTTTLGLFFILLLSVNYNIAQTISAKVIDSVTQEPVPFATIQFANDMGVITNGEGTFTILLDTKNKVTDSLFVSSMGYKTYKTTLGEFKDSILTLSPQNIELKNVVVSNKNYSADEIVDFIKDNVDKNYTKSFTKKRLFFREHYHQYLNRTNYSNFESTIDAFNKNFVDEIISSVPRSDDYYVEVLCDLYGTYNSEKQKIDVIKASKMYDKNSEINLDQLEERMEKILKENVKPDSYLKIKSGIFGTKIDNEELFRAQVDSSDVAALNKKLEEDKKRKEEQKLHFAAGRANKISTLYEDLFFMNDSKLNFLSKSRKYDFSIRELTYLGQDIVYILDFVPSGNADYKGTLYVNADDFAIVRVDYENVKSLKSFKLLGVFMNDYLDKGKMIFYKGPDDKYNLRYIEKEHGGMGGAKRPLKIIEYNKVVKGKNRQNELSLDFDFAATNINSYEIVIYDTEEISSSTFEGKNFDNKITPTYLTRYDPEFWKGYNIIEPNQAIKTYTAKEESSK
ncbi:carboxypeptidase-like regulatory domain-containing protein [Cellulophaga sp. Ld12]|uniref:carboxypeptidase-like regulatory domain-containing protein n=1 Tax=Cellulophaga sp. Ld12 TaxID=3229535 RepID=UPI00386AC3AC